MIEDLENLDKIARENLILAQNEEKLLPDLKKFSIQQMKKSKSRESLVKNELELADIREEYARKSKEFLNKKEAVKKLLDLSEANLKYEENQSIYNQKVAVAHRKIAGIHKQISEIEKSIAEERLKIYNIRFDKVKIRKSLGKKQLKYINQVNKDAPEIKTSKLKEDFQSLQAKLNGLDEQLGKKFADISTFQNKLAELKKQLSNAFSEREKIRSPLY
ncbi:MAG: hypothetical protein ACFFAS_20550 [Promethearchaeota archaeon]